MTDSTSWQPPAGATPTGPPSPYGPPVPLGSQPGAVRPGTPPPGMPPPATPAGWTPPPKPGLIPLRPLTLGTLLGASFQVLRRNPRPTFGFSLLVTGLTYLVTIGVVALVTVLAFSRLQFAQSGEDAQAIAAGSVALVVLSGLVTVAFSVVGSAILQGVMSLEVARGTLGEKLRLPGLWRAARGRIGALIGWSALIAGAAIVALAIVIVIVGAIAALGGPVGVVVSVVLGLLFFAVALAVALWLGTKLALVPSALMLERLPLRAAVARSWSLTTGYFWKTLGILLLVSVIIQLVSGVISTPLQLVVTFGTTFFDPNGSNEGLLVGAAIVYLLTIVFAVVFGAIGAVVLGATPALIYIDIRMRKEGLDLELSRFVEARQAGNTAVTDPYLPTAPTGTPPTAPSPWS